MGFDLAWHQNGIAATLIQSEPRAVMLAHLEVAKEPGWSRLLALMGCRALLLSA